MKLKGYSIGFILILCIIFDSQGQGLYFKLGGSYALPMGSQSLMEPQTISSDIVGNSTVVTNSSESLKGSYGSGIYYDFTVGYKFTPFIGVDLNVSYQTGKEYQGSSVATSANTDVEVSQRNKAQGIFVSPTAMFMTGAGVVRPYLMVGAIMGTTKIEETTELFLSGRDQPLDGKIVYDTNGDFAFGFRGGAGIDFNIASKFSIYLQMTFNSISYYAKEKNVVEYVLDGVDELPSLSVQQKTTIFC